MDPASLGAVKEQARPVVHVVWVSGRGILQHPANPLYVELQFGVVGVHVAPHGVEKGGFDDLVVVVPLVQYLQGVG